MKRFKTFTVAIVLLLVIIIPSASLISCSSEESGPDVDLNFNENFDQFAMPDVGDDIAVINVQNFGEITVRFFPEYAPRAVENFLYLARDGYYDGSSFHRIISDFMVQGGAPADDGEERTAFDNENFGIERTINLYHFAGALAMARRGAIADNEGNITREANIDAMENGQGGEFYIVHSGPDNINRMAMPGLFARVEQQIEDNYLVDFAFPQSIKDMYREIGGAPELDMGYTVFGQVIDGMDVVNAIASVRTIINEMGSERSVPADDIIIESITITTFGG